MPKQARLNRIKTFRCYTIEEAAEVSGVSTRTIRKFVSDGLRAMQSAKPTLIRGDDLLAFIKGRRKKRKAPLDLDRFYCLRCRAPRKAAEGLAEYLEKDDRLTVIAICDTCETLLRKPVARADLPRLRNLLELQMN